MCGVRGMKISKELLEAEAALKKLLLEEGRWLTKTLWGKIQTMMEDIRQNTEEREKE